MHIFSDPCYWAVIYAYTVQPLGIALQAVGFGNIEKEHANKAHMSKCFKFKQEPADDL